LRSAKYSSAAETNIFAVESRIRRISLALAKFEKMLKQRNPTPRAQNFAALVWF
jgi:hypothetical protein